MTFRIDFGVLSLDKQMPNTQWEEDIERVHLFLHPQGWECQALPRKRMQLADEPDHLLLKDYFTAGNAEEDPTFAMQTGNKLVTILTAKDDRTQLEHSTLVGMDHLFDVLLATGLRTHLTAFYEKMHPQVAGLLAYRLVWRAPEDKFLPFWKPKRQWKMKPRIVFDFKEDT
ncbi:MAG: hypothetical protein DI628_08170 [Blastochloris viridis]|uniref:Uncharacterized protein n=1 Tax=Blastochloris viridis TaxID=1079 RepID=A0A6N4R9U4_BLAVI|nr:MAG: hypothetical protein DI628_08170 [Blastochloris viridis]